MARELTPPEALTPPEPVAAVPQSQAAQMITLDEQQIAKLDTKVNEFIHAVLTLDTHTPQFREKVTAIHQLGNDEIRKAAGVSNRMLDRPVKAMNNEVMDQILTLRKTVDDLDPATQGNLFAPRKLLGLIPWGNALESYFRKYESAQGHIQTIVSALYRGQDELRKDNAAIEHEKVNLWTMMTRLQQYVYVGKKIDAALEACVVEMESRDPEKARVVREEMLFYVRQKIQDLLTQLAVSIQGYLALDVVRKNNLELVKGVDRATTTTVSALRTAVSVAQALNNQKLVLDQITALNMTTGNIIEGTSALLRGQATQIQDQAASSTIQLEKLQTAFSNIFATMDMMAEYKTKALVNMRQTVEVLTTEVTKAQTYLDRVRQGEAAQTTGELNLS
jgi:uncharacterized protein YaaN involved in tellurite resistance